MASPRKICIVTGSRAEYGLLYWLMKEIAADPGLELQIIATGMHLSPEFGLTYQVIEADGFRIDGKVEMLLSSDTSLAINKSVALGTIGISEQFERLKPDLVMILGDRFEILAAAQAALFCRIPLAHLHGGELTEGAYDDSIRHAVTKMAHYHFVANDVYRKRVVQMGENPKHVFNVGTVGLDFLQGMKLLDRAEIEKQLGVVLSKKTFLITLHPTTLGELDTSSAADALLAALAEFRDTTFIFTYPNADSGGRVIIQKIEEFIQRHPTRAYGFISLGQLKYLSVMRIADVIIGNSSSALTEGPALKKASVNIGDRQKGRIKASSVIDAEEKQDSIHAAIEKALSKDFQKSLGESSAPHGTGSTARRIVELIHTLEPGIRKEFFDIPHDR